MLKAHFSKVCNLKLLRCLQKEIIEWLILNSLTHLSKKPQMWVQIYFVIVEKYKCRISY